MAKKSRVTFTGVETVTANMGKYGEQAKGAIANVFDYWIPQIERHAKTSAPWTDRTANARSGLYAWKDTKDGKLRLYLSQTVYYGLWLEVRFAGKYAVIEPTLSLYQRRVMRMIQKIFA